MCTLNALSLRHFFYCVEGVHPSLSLVGFLEPFDVSAGQSIIYFQNLPLADGSKVMTWQSLQSNMGDPYRFYFKQILMKILPRHNF